MQEDDHHPSDEFLLELGKFLQSCGREVPFVLPEQKPKESAPGTELSPQAQYRKAVRDKDWTSAINHKKQ